MKSFPFKFKFLLLFIILVASWLWPRQGLSQARPQVCILQIAECPALDANRKGIVDALVANGYDAPSYECAQGNQALAKTIAQKFIAQKPKVIVAIGTPAAQAFLGEPACPPLVFSAVTDPQAARLLQNPNITGVSDAVPAEEQLVFFQKLLPSLKVLGMIHNPSEINSVLALEKTQKAAQLLGITIKVASANKNSEVMAAAQSLSSSCQALFVNNDNLALVSLPSIVTVANQNKIPVFCSDLEALDQGVAAALGPDQYGLGEQAGQKVLAILKNTPPAHLPVSGPDAFKEAVNGAQLKRLGMDAGL